MYVIAVAGLPGSGKSYLAKLLSERLECILLSKDSFKEILFDSIGFHNRNEKTALNAAALETMFYVARQIVESGGNVILENNFEKNAYPYFECLSQVPSVSVITVFVGGDKNAIYKRYIARDKDPSRHRGHVLSTEYPERTNIGIIPEPISFQLFCRRFAARGMSNFCVGSQLIRVDATDFSKVDYDDIVLQVRKAIELCGD